MENLEGQNGLQVWQVQKYSANLTPGARSRIWHPRVETLLRVADHAELTTRDAAEEAKVEQRGRAVGRAVGEHQRHSIGHWYVVAFATWINV